MSYDVLRRLATWQNVPGTSPSQKDTSVYDGEGQRIQQIVTNSGTTTTTNYIQGIEEIATTGSTTTTTKYYPAGLVQAVSVNGSVTYLVPDALGSISEDLDASGNVLAEQLFGPYGNVRYSAGSMPGSHGYTGQVQDASGLAYFNARYYDPVVGQFTSADTVQGPNRYGYVAGNPETLTDPTGTMYCECGMGGGNGTTTGGGGGKGSTTSGKGNIGNATNNLCTTALCKGAVAWLGRVGDAIGNLLFAIGELAELILQIKEVMNSSNSGFDRLKDIAGIIADAASMAGFILQAINDLADNSLDWLVNYANAAIAFLNGVAATLDWAIHRFENMWAFGAAAANLFVTGLGWLLGATPASAVSTAAIQFVGTAIKSFTGEDIRDIIVHGTSALYFASQSIFSSWAGNMTNALARQFCSIGIVKAIAGGCSS